MVLVFKMTKTGHKYSSSKKYLNMFEFKCRKAGLCWFLQSATLRLPNLFPFLKTVSFFQKKAARKMWTSFSIKARVWYYIKMKLCPDQCDSVCWPSTWKGKVASWNPGQGTWLGCRFSPWLGGIWEEPNVFLTQVFLLLSFSLPSLSLKINKIFFKKMKSCVFKNLKPNSLS